MKKHMDWAQIEIGIDQAHATIQALLVNPPTNKYAVRPQLLREIAHVLPQAKTLRGERDLNTINNYFQGLVRYSILDSWQCETEMEKLLASQLIELARTYEKWYETRPVEN